MWHLPYYENVDKAIWDMIHDTHGLSSLLAQNTLEQVYNRTKYM
jgi:hypothetical protein